MERILSYDVVCKQASLILAGQYNTNMTWHVTTKRLVGYYKFTINYRTSYKDAAVLGSKTINKKFRDVGLVTYGGNTGFVLGDELNCFLREAYLQVGDSFYIKPFGSNNKQKGKS